MTEAEIPQPVPQTAIQDKDVAWNMAYAQKPYWEAERTRDAEGANTADKLTSKGLTNPTIPKPVSDVAPDGLVQGASPEKNQNQHERLIKDTTDEAIAVFDMWLEGHDTPREHRSGGRSAFMDVFTSPSVIRKPLEEAYGAWIGFMPAGRYGDRVDAGITEVASKQGITEAVFISDDLPKVTFGTFNPNSKHTDDSIVVVRYQTLATGSKKYKFNSPLKRSGLDIKAQILLPKTIADQLGQEIQQDPKTIRQVIDNIIQERIQAGTDWDSARPPYEEWAEVNQSVNKMLLYSGKVNDFFKQAKVLEWREDAE
jgi:hypothetical protein